MCLVNVCRIIRKAIGKKEKTCRRNLATFRASVSIELLVWHLLWPLPRSRLSLLYCSLGLPFSVLIAILLGLQPLKSLGSLLHRGLLSSWRLKALLSPDPIAGVCCSGSLCGPQPILFSCEFHLLSLFNPRDMKDWSKVIHNPERTLLTLCLQVEISQYLDFNRLFIIQLINTYWELTMCQVPLKGVNSTLLKNTQIHDHNGSYNLVRMADN